MKLLNGMFHRDAALDILPSNASEQARPTLQLVLASQREFRANSIAWSFTYFGTVVLSAVCSASAALVLKLDSLFPLGVDKANRADVAAALATLATLLVTISTTGDFRTKWQANRRAAASLEGLCYDIVAAGSSLDVAETLRELKRINRAQNDQVTGLAPAQPEASNGKHPEGDA